MATAEIIGNAVAGAGIAGVVMTYTGVEVQGIVYGFAGGLFGATYARPLVTEHWYLRVGHSILCFIAAALLSATGGTLVAAAMHAGSLHIDRWRNLYTGVLGGCFYPIFGVLIETVPARVKRFFTGSGVGGVS